MKFYDKIVKYKRYFPSATVILITILFLIYCFVSLLYLPIRSTSIKSITISDIVLTYPYNVDDLCLVINQPNPNRRLFPFIFYGDTQNTDDIKNQQFYIDDSNFITCSVYRSDNGSFLLYHIAAETKNMKKNFSVANCKLGETTRKEVKERFHSYLKLKDNSNVLEFKVENYTYKFVFKDNIIDKIEITVSIAR